MAKWFFDLDAFNKFSRRVSGQTLPDRIRGWARENGDASRYTETLAREARLLYQPLDHRSLQNVAGDDPDSIEPRCKKVCDALAGPSKQTRRARDDMMRYMSTYSGKLDRP